MTGLPSDGHFHGANFLRNATGSGPLVRHWDTLHLFQFIISLTGGEATLKEAVVYIKQARPGSDFQALRRAWGDAAAEAYLPQCVRLLRKTASEAALQPRDIAPKGTVHCIGPHGSGAGANTRWVLFIAYTLPDDAVRCASGPSCFRPTPDASGGDCGDHVGCWCHILGPSRPNLHFG